MMQLSVVIVNYNVKFFLEQCLYSVRRAAENLLVEVIVVDNNSVDGSVEMVKNKFPEVKLIESKENLGFSKGNNLGIKIATGNYVLLLNPDTVVKEDTFSKTIQFMDQHPEAGALGVKMIDGRGKFLPESKRGLPTPLVAFFKIFGLSALFPTSKIVGKYHLGYLSNNQNHEVDVLSGAFMFIRKEALDKAGLLDETFFMYGEDIDLSYRIQQAGFKNYYFSETSIIHYKGESTKKSSVNYVFVFYNAMIIFAKKHFSQKNAVIFSFLINIAIYLRASVAIGFRIISRIFLPVLDSLLIFGGMFILKIYWENYHKYVPEPYGPDFMGIMVPVYILCWLLGVYFTGGYDRPYRLGKIIRGILVGTLAIACLYAFLDEEWRFSRALIVLGSFWALIALPLFRLTLQWLKIGGYKIDGSSTFKKIIIVANEQEGEKILSIVKDDDQQVEFIGFVQTDDRQSLKDVRMVGYFHQLKEIIQIYKIDEVIFSSKSLELKKIIDVMAGLDLPWVEFKIAPEESMFIIGSNSIHNMGNLYTIEIKFNINSPIHKRNKRFFDIIASLILLFMSPILIFKIHHKLKFLKNIFEVLIGNKTWVSYHLKKKEQINLPKLNSGVLSPTAIFDHRLLDNNTIERLNFLYAKNYRWYNDLELMIQQIHQLGND